MNKMKISGNKIRTSLIILAHNEVQRNNSSMMINSLTDHQLSSIYEEIEISLQKEFFKPDNKTTKTIHSPEIKRKLQFSTKNVKQEYNSMKSVIKKPKSQRRVSFFDGNQQLIENKTKNEGNLMNVYARFLDCLDSKKSIGHEKIINFQDKVLKRPSLVKYTNNSDSTKKSNIIINDYFENSDEKNQKVDKIESVIGYLNRGKEFDNEITRKKRVKWGIFYLHSLIYCLKKTGTDLQKNQKNKDEFNDLRKELLSPLLKIKKSSKVVSFEVLKKVFIWKEESKERHESTRKLTLIGADLNNTMKKRFSQSSNALKKQQSRSVRLDKSDLEKIKTYGTSPPIKTIPIISKNSEEIKFENDIDQISSEQSLSDVVEEGNTNENFILDMKPANEEVQNSNSVSYLSLENKNIHNQNNDNKSNFSGSPLDSCRNIVNEKGLNEKSMNSRKSGDMKKLLLAGIRKNSKFYEASSSRRHSYTCSYKSIENSISDGSVGSSEDDSIYSNEQEVV